MLPFPLLNPNPAMITARCVPRTAACFAAALAFTPLLTSAEKRPREQVRQCGSTLQVVDTLVDRFEHSSLKISGSSFELARIGSKKRGRKQDLQDLLQEEAEAHAQLARELTRALEAQTHLTRLSEASSFRLRKSLTLQKHIARQATATSEELRRALRTQEEENERVRRRARKFKEALALARQKLEIERAVFANDREEFASRLASVTLEAAKPKRAPLALKVEPLHFAMNRTATAEEENRLLTQVRTILAIRPDATLRVTGHTCDIGDSRANFSLSERRAQHIAEFLIREGVPAARITEVRGLGPEHPLADNSTLTGRRLNRRVEVEFLSP